MHMPARKRSLYALDTANAIRTQKNYFVEISKFRHRK